jgi:hypothetical protein
MPNWRSFTGIWRKRNARTLRTAGSAESAFVYRDMAEIERQNANGRRRAAATRTVMPAMRSIAGGVGQMTATVSA